MSTRCIRLFVTLILLSAVVCAEEAAKNPPPPDETVMMVDLRAPLSGLFQYGSWEGKVAALKSGLAVHGAKGAQGKGGMGRDLAPALDLSEVSFVEVALGVVPGNEVPQITIALNDGDGTQFTARINIGQLVPGQPVWLRARREDFKLNGIEPGADSKMDWSKVARWHLQGDWTTAKPFQVIFIALRTRK